MTVGGCRRIWGWVRCPDCCMRPGIARYDYIGNKDYRWKMMEIVGLSVRNYYAKPLRYSFIAQNNTSAADSIKTYEGSQCLCSAVGRKSMVCSSTS